MHENLYADRSEKSVELVQKTPEALRNDVMSGKSEINIFLGRKSKYQTKVPLLTVHKSYQEHITS